MMIDKFCELIETHISGWSPLVFYDIGADSCAQSVELVTRFEHSFCYSFEANPNNHEMCVREAKANPRITFLPFAICEHVGTTTFFHVPTNGGAGSVFKPSGKYDPIEPMPSVELTVPCTRLDVLIEQKQIAPADALWLDAQGSELAILKSMGQHLASVRCIWTEFEYLEMYSGQPLIGDLFPFLERQGFKKLFIQDCVSGCFGEAFFARQ